MNDLMKLAEKWDETARHYLKEAKDDPESVASYPFKLIAKHISKCSEELKKALVCKE